MTEALVYVTVVVWAALMVRYSRPGHPSHARSWFELLHDAEGARVASRRARRRG